MTIQEKVEQKGIVELTDSLSVAAQCLEELIHWNQAPKEQMKITYQGDLQQVRDNLELIREMLWDAHNEEIEEEQS